MVSDSYNEIKLNNNLKVYSEHFDCLKTSICSIEICENLIGNPVDFLYEYVSFFSKLVLGEGGFVYSAPTN
jgi:hypothetical protein